eukprot:6187780-Pleurochrysis_carterae.AAC.6
MGVRRCDSRQRHNRWRALPAHGLVMIATLQHSSWLQLPHLNTAHMIVATPSESRDILVSRARAPLMSNSQPFVTKRIYIACSVSHVVKIWTTRCNGQHSTLLGSRNLNVAPAVNCEVETPNASTIALIFIAISARVRGSEEVIICETDDAIQRQASKLCSRG